MTEHQDSTRISRVLPLGLLLASATACPLPVQFLEGGMDSQGTDTGDTDPTDTADTEGETSDGEPNDPNAECLIGTLHETVGTETDYWSPGCPVVCDEGWAHADVQLDIAWTLTLDDPEGYALSPAGLVARENGEPLVVGFTQAGRILAQAVDADGQLDWEIQVPTLGSEVRNVRMWGSRLYLHQRDLIGITSLVVMGDDGATPIAGREYGVDPVQILDFDVSDLGVVVLYEEGGSHILELLTHDLVPKWSEPAAVGTTEIALGEAPDSAIVLANLDMGRVEAFDANATPTWSELLGGEFQGSGELMFMDERLFLSGATPENDRFDGAITGMIPGSDIWYRTYGRASSWCPDPDDTQYDDDTSDFFGDLAILADGTLLMGATEAYEGQGQVGSQPLVVRMSVDGEFLGRDRGLWQGYTNSVLAGPNQTALMLAADEELGQVVLRAYSL